MNIGGFKLDSIANINPFDFSSNGMINTISSGINGLYNDYMGITSAKLSAEQAKENLQKQLAWERERATSAHQWEVQDLKKAGLNPVLSANGQGAITGGITPQQSDFSSLQKGAQNLVGTLMQIAPMISQLKMNSAATKKINAEAAKTKSETAINDFIKSIKKYESENFSRYYEAQISKSPKWLVDQFAKLFNYGSNSTAAKKIENATFDLLGGNKEPWKERTFNEKINEQISKEIEKATGGNKFGKFLGNLIIQAITN